MFSPSPVRPRSTGEGLFPRYGVSSAWTLVDTCGRDTPRSTTRHDIKPQQTAPYARFDYVHTVVVNPDFRC